MLIKLGLILRQDILLEFVLRGNFGPDSDVDVFVEFETGHVPVFFRLSDLEKELSSLFDGRKVDLLTPEDLSRHFRIELVAKAEVPYAQD
jgi:predicted nucleotidyltransferase